MAEEIKNPRHSLIMEQRERLSVTGVKEVLSFDEELIAARTEMGVMLVRGNGLHISRLNLERGELGADGMVESISYEKTEEYTKPAVSLLGKIFR